MKRLTIVLSLLAASAALAQRREAPIRPARDTAASTSPLAVGGAIRERVPMLRSYVQGWQLTGSRPEAYEVRCDEVFTACGMPIFRTRASAGEPYGTGSLTHTEPATHWRGAKLRLKAELRGGRIDGWAGLWMRIDGPDGKVLAFDNMQDRPIRGTTQFKEYTVVLDVPENAERLTLGVLLHGPGAVWVRELQLDEVQGDVATTDLLAPLRRQAKVEPKAEPQKTEVDAAPAAPPPPDVAKAP